MGMKSLDLANPLFQASADALVKAAAGDDASAAQQAFVDFANTIQAAVLEEAAKVGPDADRQVLAQRGVRQLTSAENKFYKGLGEAYQSSKPLQALENLDVVMPKTIIEDVFTDLETNHPLLAAIDFKHGIGLTSWLMNANPNQLATWSPLCAEIIKELTSGFREITLTQNKLSAFIPICKAMLDLGPQWLDRYVRAVLAEALALGLEDGILNGRGQTNGDGNNPAIAEPIGTRKNLAGSVSQATGYPDKTKEVVTSLDPVSYGNLAAKLAVTENGRARTVTGLILVVNPIDYLKKIMPATTIRTPVGQYVNDVLPLPTTVIQSTRMAEGEAVFGIAGNYLMVSANGQSGKTEYSDHYQFLEDNRVYLVKFYGHGQPKDNNSFLLLDISGLEPLVQQVYVTNMADLPTP